MKSQKGVAKAKKGKLQYKRKRTIEDSKSDRTNTFVSKSTTLKKEKQKTAIKLKKGKIGKSNKLLKFEVSKINESENTFIDKKKLKHVKTMKNKNFSKKNGKLFKEEQFPDIENNNKSVGEIDIVVKGKLKKKKKLNNIEAHKNEQNVKKSKKKNKKQIVEAKTNLIEKKSKENDTTCSIKKKKLNRRKVQDANDDGSKTDKPKVPRTSPNAVKYMIINLIKTFLHEKISMSKEKLQEKVIEKFCKITGREQKPELLKDYEKSLMLTYGIEIVDDIVKINSNEKKSKNIKGEDEENMYSNQDNLLETKKKSLKRKLNNLKNTTATVIKLPKTDKMVLLPKTKKKSKSTQENGIQNGQPEQEIIFKRRKIEEELSRNWLKKLES